MLFTGRYPSSRGAHTEHRYLDDRYPTLAQVMQANGHETLCFTANAWISDGLGLTRGFAWQDDSLRSEGGAGLGFSFIHRLLDRLGLQDADKGGAIVAASFEEWARERPASDRPSFVFLNSIEAHFSYHRHLVRGCGDFPRALGHGVRNLRDSAGSWPASHLGSEPETAASGPGIHLDPCLSPLPGSAVRFRSRVRRRNSPASAHR